MLYQKNKKKGKRMNEQKTRKIYGILNVLFAFYLPIIYRFLREFIENEEKKEKKLLARKCKHKKNEHRTMNIVRMKEVKFITKQPFSCCSFTSYYNFEAYEL